MADSKDAEDLLNTLPDVLEAMINAMGAIVMVIAHQLDAPKRASLHGELIQLAQSRMTSGATTTGKLLLVLAEAADQAKSEQPSRWQ